MKIRSCLILLAFISFANSLLTEEFLDSPLHKPELIEKINSSDLPWKAGVNEKFKDATVREFKRYLGNLKTPKEDMESVETITHSEEFIKDLPEEFNVIEAHPECHTIIGNIQDQSSCGSCWANAASQVMSDRTCIHSNASVKVLLATNDLLACCDLCGNGCDGGFSLQAFRYWGYKGLVTGGNYQDEKSCMPYPFEPCAHHTESTKYKPCGQMPDFQTPICYSKCQDLYSKEYSKDKYFGTAYKLPRDEAQIRAEIFKNGPVSAGYEVYDDFENYKSGVYIKTEGAAHLGGHAVRIIGWGTENGIPYWLVANSWNETWGLNGYFKIRRGTNECDFESEIYAGIPREKQQSLEFLQ